MNSNTYKNPIKSTNATSRVLQHCYRVSFKLNSMVCHRKMLQQIERTRHSNILVWVCFKNRLIQIHNALHIATGCVSVKCESFSRRVTNAFSQTIQWTPGETIYRVLLFTLLFQPRHSHGRSNSSPHKIRL